ncbi:MAG TPA: hypothetical protein VGM97_02795 [Steroidobacteraceae bacterium]|jgi:hypothetical protein
MRHPLARQQKHGPTVSPAENCRQHVEDTDFGPAAVLYVEHSAPQHSLETGLRLHFVLIIRRSSQIVGLDVLSKVGSEPIEISAAADKCLTHRRRFEDGEQQMLDGDEFRVRAVHLTKGLFEARLKFAR